MMEDQVLAALRRLGREATSSEIFESLGKGSSLNAVQVCLSDMALRKKTIRRRPKDVGNGFLFSLPEWPTARTGTIARPPAKPAAEPAPEKRIHTAAALRELERIGRETETKYADSGTESPDHGTNRGETEMARPPAALQQGAFRVAIFSDWTMVLENLPGHPESIRLDRAQTEELIGLVRGL